jgi:hypothetical protein
VHRNPSTGIDWSRKRRGARRSTSAVTKLAGLWLTWGAIAAIYALSRVWGETRYANYPFAMWCFEMIAPALFVASIPYVLWLDRRLVSRGRRLVARRLADGREGTGRPRGDLQPSAQLGGEGFFLAFMVAIVPPGFGEFVRWDISHICAIRWLWPTG